jgi:hypothetical protein
MGDKQQLGKVRFELEKRIEELSATLTSAALSVETRYANQY